MRFRLDPFSPSGVSVAIEPSVIQQVRQSNGYVVNKATGLITAGSNITITGSGTQESPYKISSISGGGGGGGGDSLTNTDGATLTLTNDASAFGQGIVHVPPGIGTDTNYIAAHNLNFYAGANADASGAFAPGFAVSESGSIVFTTNNPTTSGNNSYQVVAEDGMYLGSDGTNFALLKTDNLTANRTLQYPNAAGTFALTSDITKAAVGLANVDNTSDATKNSAVATLTNKDLTSGTNTFPTFNQNTTGSAATLTTARTIDGQSFNGSANITVIAPGTHAATSKATPVDADELPLVDSAASNILKKLTWANLKATAKTYFDTLYQAVLVSGTNIKTINGTSLLGSGDITVSGGSSTPRIQHFHNFETSTRYTTSTSGTSALTTFQSTGAYLAKGTTTTGGTSATVSGVSPTAAFAVFDKNPIYNMTAQAEIASASNTWDFSSVFGGSGNASAGFTGTAKHFGFILRNNNGTEQVVCTNANGTTQTTTVITQSITANTSSYTAVMTSGTDIKFYCDGTLLATHTTNLPSGSPPSGNTNINILKASAGTNNNAIFLCNTSQSYNAY